MYLIIPETYTTTCNRFSVCYVALYTIKAFLCYMSSGSVKYFVVRLISREYERILFYKQPNNFLCVIPLDVNIKKGFVASEHEDKVMLHFV